MTGKRVHYSYLDAAREVLRRQGGAMHYDSIGIAAVNLGLLNTKSRNPTKQMGVALCQAVANTKGSDFRRVRPGVFELAEHANLGTPLGRYASLGRRIAILSVRLQLRDDAAVLRRALWVVRKCLVVKGGWEDLQVDGRRVALDPDSLCSDRLSIWTRRMGDDDVEVSLDLPGMLSREYINVARSVGINLRAAVAFAISLLEQLLDLTHDRQVKIKGEGGTEVIWLR